MASAAEVRASRDGDRFHYYWAASRALKLLDLTSDLRAVWVEGLPVADQSAGEEVVDVAEYFGGDDADSASAVVYTQVKHSTLRRQQPIETSELKTMLTKFALLYRAGVASSRSLTFAFVANRSLRHETRVTLQELSQGAHTFTHPSHAALLTRYLDFENDTAAQTQFCQKLMLRDGSPGIVELETELVREVRHFLPGGGTGSELALLVEMVSRRATSLAQTQEILRRDVLVALRTTEQELFPAPNKIDIIPNPIRTPDVDIVTGEIIGGANRRLLITAVGGMGKSVLTTQIAAGLPDGSIAVVYDCFAGGDYRKLSEPRHRHRQALTQLANEVAAKGLCSPLIPTAADDSAYARLFMDRLSTAARQLELERPHAVLAVIIDAADNAALAAADLRERAFVTDLWREAWPTNTRLVMFCRPERKQLLDVPANGVTEIAMHGFSAAQTCAHLRSRFPATTDHDGSEFHALSGGNPRVQAMAMTAAHSPDGAIESLQITSKQAGDALDSLLAQQVARVAAEGHLAPNDLQRLCGALASLHPSVPLADLASITELPVDAIRSFAVELGRGLHVSGTTLQFRDEPTETWFRTTFGFDAVQKQAFARAVQAHATKSPYLANALPQMLHEAGLGDELVDLALSDSGLPGDIDDLEAHEIARSRTRFALSATLRAGQRVNAARLAVRNGVLSAGRTRKLAMFRANPDLAARFLGAQWVEETCAHRDLATDWPGSNLHLEAAMLAHVPDFKDLARARLRSALDNLRANLQASAGDRMNRFGHQVVADVATDIGLAAELLDGPEGLHEFVVRCRPKEFGREITTKVCSRLADVGSIASLEHLARSKRGPHLRVAAADVMFNYAHTPSTEAVKKLAETLRRRTTPFDAYRDIHADGPLISGVVWATVHGVRGGILDSSDALTILERHAPPHLPDYIGSSWSGKNVVVTLLALALRARLDGQPFDVTQVASAKLSEEMQTPHRHTPSQNAQTFRDNISPLLPWIDCWLDALLVGPTKEVEARLTHLVSNSLKPVKSWNTPYVLHNAVAEVATRLLTIVDLTMARQLFTQWYRDAEGNLGRSRVPVIRIAARSPSLHEFALEALTQAVAAAQRDRTEAESRVESLTELSRAVFALSPAESEALFNTAVEEADRVGDDLHERWEALVGTSRAIGTGSEAARAYRLFQIAEALDGTESAYSAGIGSELLKMHAPTYFSAASRARDRRTLPFNVLITPAFESFATDPQSSARLATYPFRPNVGWSQVIDSLPDDVGRSCRTVFEAFARHERPDGDWSASSTSYGRDENVIVEPTPGSLSSALAKIDFTTVDGWTDALNQVGWRDDRNELAKIALDRHPSSRPQVLRSFNETTQATMRDYAAVVSVAAQREPTPGLLAALGVVARTFASRFASQIAIRRYDEESIQTVATACRLPIDDLYRHAFEIVASDAYDLNYIDSFRLGSMLAQSLEPPLASVVFDDLEALFEELAPRDTSSDGPFASLSPPPADASTCLAGLVWAALGDISAKIRWQAAHAVVLLARLRCDDELIALLAFADGSNSEEPFVDARFPFFGQHARLWLLLSLLRCAHEPNPSPVRHFGPWLAGVIRSPHHAANQLLAQRTLTQLVKARVVPLPSGEHDLLTQPVGAEWVELTWQEHRAVASGTADDEADDIGPWFFYDFPKWCRELAEVFMMGATAIQRRVVEIASGLEGFEQLESKRDPRRDAGAYGNRNGSVDDGAWPDEETPARYLAVHSLLSLAGDLARGHVAYKDPESSVDAYTEWLANYLPARSDGRWLADRRDPPPSPTPDVVLVESARHPEWPWNMNKADFERAAGIGDDWITVDANVDSRRDRLNEDVQVESVLVPKPSAMTFLAAVQTLPRGGFSLPTIEDFDYPTEPPFNLRPWIDVRRSYVGLDDLDEVGTGIPYPPPRPSEEIVRTFSLKDDLDMRTWSLRGEPVFASRVWRNLYARSRDDDEGTKGHQLRVRPDFLTTVLKHFDMYLAVQVAIRRQRTRTSYDTGKDKDDDFGWLDWSRKIYLVDSDGRWYEH